MMYEHGHHNLIITLICFVLLAVRAEKQNQEIVDGYQLMYEDAEKIKQDDLSQLSIAKSAIHGKGVLINRPLKKGESVGILYYEYLEEMDHLTATVEVDGFWHARGYISDGGMIAKQHLSVKDALLRCKEMHECQGITFQDPQRLFENPQSSLPTTEVIIEFKDKSHFSKDTENSWQSYLKEHNDSNASALYFPLGCGVAYLPNPPPAALDNHLMLPCWPRYVNHSCQPTAKVVKVPVQKGFAVPGIPWTKISGAYQVLLLKDLAERDEITLNYELLPSYMMRRVEGVQKCDKADDEL